MKLLFHNFSMIFMGCFVILPGFANQDSNCINFKDPFYTGILKTTMSELIDDPNYCMVSIKNEAEKARQQYEAMTAVWNDPNQSVYHREAATWILTHLELNEKRWLTLGTVVQMFGVPDDIEYFGLRFNGKDGIDPDTERFEVHYLEKRIAVRFSVMGFVDIVLDMDSISNTGRFYWPRQFYCAEKLPIMSFGSVEQEDFKNECLMGLTAFLSGHGDNWKSAIGNEWTAAGNTRESLHLDVKLMMLDVIRNDLVGAFYEIKHDDATLYKNIWCFFDEKKWVLIKDEELSKFLRNS